ncbi:hypothetical protein CASFOL_033507 [Castilleja foliolosa]|uniref:Trichome birefringence-like C-terminal domain-containing protein n=1 Tax=Castilleja foliolosa TaxID=1961234 RepID=A0ABD3BYB2_9LAMI
MVNSFFFRFMSRVRLPLSPFFFKPPFFFFFFFCLFPLLISNNPSPSDLLHRWSRWLYLDEPDKKWSTQIDGFDYVILSSGHWFTRTYERRRVSGCRYCQIPGIGDLPMMYGYRRAFRTAFRAINGREKFNGVWNEGGDCVRRRPFGSNETIMEGVNLDFYMAQLIQSINQI